MAKVKGADLEQADPSVTNSKKMDVDPENDWEAKDHFNTLMSAHEIMNNPDKMAKVHKLAGRRMKAVSSIQDIKDHYNDTFGSKAKKPSIPVTALSGNSTGAQGDDEES